ncbi:MAG: hypothetical protein QM765_48655 [Myxococcales bacterium]
MTRKIVPSHLDALKGPDRLTARVVDPGPPRRIAGYEVESDLARHYAFTEVAALLLRGELAPAPVAKALEVALVFLSPVTVARAPGHVGVLSRVGGSRWSVSLGLCALTLAEEAAAVVQSHSAWLDWVARGDNASAPPDGSLAQDGDDRASVERLSQLLPIPVPALEVGPTRVAAVLAVLAACGLSREAMQTAWVLAGLPAAAAEAAARPLMGVRDYPFNLPPLEYEVDE